MDNENSTKEKELTLKQKALLCFYKLRQLIYNDWFKTKNDLIAFNDSFLFYFLIYCIFLFLFNWALIKLNINIPDDRIYDLGFATAGIIGASIAIIFSFSTFILQSTADLFSTQYLNKFIQDKKEKWLFWLLVLLSIVSFLIPIFIKYFALQLLITILAVAFYLIYSLYRQLRTRINPETTLNKIRNDAINNLERVNRILKKHSGIQNKIFERKKEEESLALAVQYKSNQTWNLVTLENVKYLYEIGLRLLSKNEISSFNLTLEYIHDIYLRHLQLRDGHLIRVPASIWGVYTFEDEGFTNRILEYLESISNRIIQEKRKENIYYLLSVYESLLSFSLNIKYADKSFVTQGENPLLTLILAYYVGLIEKLIKSKETDWIWESIKSISKVSNFVLNKNYNYFVSTQLNQTINKISIACLVDNNETFLKEIGNIYFNQIRIGWNKYAEEIFWRDLFEQLKKNMLALSTSGGRTSLSISDLFITFHTWQVTVINWIIDTKDEKEKKDNLDRFFNLLEKWSHFLLDFARDEGLEDKQIGLPIIQSIDNNIRIIYGIKGNFPKTKIDLGKLYKSQFYTLSWYFHKTEKVDSDFLFNLEQALEILLREISHNLKNNDFKTDYPIELYIRLVKEHFDKADLGYGYNHPRIIKKLVYLGLFFHKYKKFSLEASILFEIDNLNKKYLELNKQFFEMKQKEENLMGPTEFQFCKELYDLEEELFSYNSGMLMDIKYIISKEISRNEWNTFKQKISYCKGIEYKTVRTF